MRDLFEQCRVDVFDVLFVRPRRVVVRNHQELRIVTGFVDHMQHADWVAGDQATRERRLSQQDQDVERVAILAERIEQKTVIRRVVRASTQRAIKDDSAIRLVELVLVAAPLRDLDVRDRLGLGSVLHKPDRLTSRAHPGAGSRCVGSGGRWYSRGVSAKKIILVAIGVIALAIGLSTLAHRVADERQQNDLDAFYATPTGLAAAKPGTVFRVETLAEAPIAGASSFRILYRTERPNGAPAVAGAMVFVPIASAPATGRPVLAYAHGTIGQGRGCAPSRRSDPVGGNIWFAQAIASGFVVVATDYAGIGTAGPDLFLNGQSESLDIVNSVRALEQVPGADPSEKWVVFGHSQGGHGALWTGQLAAQEMPEKTLIGVAAAAPAADLPMIIGRQWNTGVGWGVGAEVARSWPATYPNLDFAAAISSEGNRWTDQVADACLGEGMPIPPLLGMIAAAVGVPYFNSNPIDVPRIAKVAAEQTPKPLPATLPLMIAQGTADTVIPPESNAALQTTWCAAGSNLTMLWLGGVGHVAAGTTAAPTIVPWLRAIFDGRTPAPQCDGVPPVPVAGMALNEAVLPAS